MRIMDAQRRPLYLRALKFFNEGEQDKNKRLLVFASPIQVRKQAAKGEFPLHQDQGTHAKLVDVTEDTLVLTMHGGIKVDVYLPFPVGAGSPHVGAVDVPPERPLTIPLDLVRAIWRAGPPQHRLQLVVEGVVQWRGDQWSLVVSRTE